MSNLTTKIAQVMQELNNHVEILNCHTNLLNHILDTLKAKPNGAHHTNPKPPGTMTMKGILSQLGKTGDGRANSMLGMFAEDYCQKHNLKIEVTGSNKSWKHYPIEAATYAMEKYKELKS